MSKIPDKLMVKEAERIMKWGLDMDKPMAEAFLSAVHENNSLRAALEKCREFQVDDELDRIIDPVLKAYDNQNKDSDNGN